jgi:hypothetical protein
VEILVEVVSHFIYSLRCFNRAFNFGEFINGKAQQPLPSPIAPDELRYSAFADSCHGLCNKILHLLGIGLGVSFLSTLSDVPRCSSPC